jgi:N-methylhydantoinase A
MDFARSYGVRLDEVDWSRVAALYAEMEDQGIDAMVEAGVAANDVLMERSVELRYALQGYSLQIGIPNRDLERSLIPILKQRFETAHAEQYGRLNPEVPVEAGNWRLWVHTKQPPIHLWVNGSPSSAHGAGPKAVRPVYLPPLREFRDVPVYDRETLASGRWHDGPAIVEERESTAVIGLNSRFTLDEQKNLIVEFV